MSQSSLSKETLQPLRDQPDALIEIILRQGRQIQELMAKIEQLEKQIRDLNDRNNGLSSKVEELEKAAVRAAAPFRIDPHRRVRDPKKPGRKEGHPGSCRKVPDHIDEEIRAPLDRCPHCGKEPGPRKDLVQYIEELPVVQPRVIKLITQQARCPHCQKQVRSTHALQVSLAQGAAGTHLGPRVLGMAAELNKKHGLTMRKTCAVLEQLFGLRLSAGGLSAALERLAGKLKPACENLLARLRDGPVVHSDETSWWVGGPGHWLWVFANKDTTVYQVACGRGRNIIVQALGPQFSGVLVSDCLAIYNDVNALQHKCYSHHLRAIDSALESGPNDYLERWRTVLKAAMALKKAGPPAAQDPQGRALLEQSAERLLAAPQPGLAEKVRMRLLRQRDHLFTFLDHPQVEATNNLAERQLRPAVIARKISCGNKTQAGARTWETLTSLAATCAQRGESFAQLVGQAALLSYAR